MTGKAKCRILREIRVKIAQENDIEYITRDCTYQGKCRGTCPKCESELRYLEEQLEKRRKLGKTVSVVAVAAAVSLGLAGCSLPDIDPQRLGDKLDDKFDEIKDKIENRFARYGGGPYSDEGAIALEGDVAYVEDDDVLEGVPQYDGDDGTGEWLEEGEIEESPDDLEGAVPRESYE